MIKNLEEAMYQLSDFFMVPVLVLLIILFAYSLYALGMFACQTWQRKANRALIATMQKSNSLASNNTNFVSGYPLVTLALSNNNISRDDLDVAALEELETVRLVSRIAPMLGLIATMIPMGPALKSLADGNVQGISENLIVAFSAVIFGLVIASITFWVASVKKRWLAAELVAVARLLEPELMLDEKQKEKLCEAA